VTNSLTSRPLPRWQPLSGSEPGAGFGGGIPGLQEKVDQPLAQAIESGRQQSGDESRGIDRKVDCGAKRLPPSSRNSEGRETVDTRVCGDAADRPGLVPTLAKWARAAARIFSPFRPRPAASSFEAFSLEHWRGTATR